MNDFNGLAIRAARWGRAARPALPAHPIGGQGLTRPQILGDIFDGIGDAQTVPQYQYKPDFILNLELGSTLPERRG